MTAEDRDSRLREWAVRIFEEVEQGALVQELPALLSAFADEVRAAEYQRCLASVKAADHAGKLAAAEAGKREAEERARKLESALANTTAAIIVDGNRADLKLARDVAEAEVARLREERDALHEKLSDALGSGVSVALGIEHHPLCAPETLCCRCRMEAAQRQVEELRRELAERTAERDAWRFVPDEHGGHMLAVRLNAKWYPETFLRAHASALERERDEVRAQERATYQNRQENIAERDEARRERDGLKELTHQQAETIRRNFDQYSADVKGLQERVGALEKALRLHMVFHGHTDASPCTCEACTLGLAALQGTEPKTEEGKS